MTSLVLLIHTILDIYKWCLIIWVVLSWLIQFNVVNTYNKFVFTVNDVLYRITEPALRPIRRVVPNLGGVDLSPLVLILLIWFTQDLMVRNLL
jgi:YggT family protein